MSTNLHDLLAAALLENNAIPKIERALKGELEAAGWVTELKGYIVNLIRTGEATSYGEIMERVLGAVHGGGERGEVNGEGEGGGNGGGEGNNKLAIPEKAVVAGVKVVREELEKIVDVVVDD